jgi:ADP-heptose:LPS heptosyltransferase
MNCLVIKNDGIGDLILASGVIAEISRLIQGNVDLVTCEANTEVAKNIPGVRNCFFLSRDKLKFYPLLERFGLELPKIEPNDAQVLSSIQDSSYDISICLRRFIRQSTLIIMRRVQAQKKYCAWQFPTNASLEGAKRFSRGWEMYLGDSRTLSELEYNQKFIEEIFKTSINPHPRLKCTDGVQMASESKTIGIGLGGSSTTWPQAYWKEVINALKASGWKVLLFGGSDVEKTGKLVGDGCENYVGRLSLTQSVEHLKRVTVYLGNDTGLSHFASLFIPKCVIVLGGGTFRRFFPWPNTTNQHIIYHGLDCFDCDWQCKFPKRYCLEKITPRDVLSWTMQVVEGKNHTRHYPLHSHVENYPLGWARSVKSNVQLEAVIPE